ncbi:hypothetical protein HHI36_004862 [Cryptolaemus montrouzieri]|uniref:Uncharacterized protein n=1 Tax=Cryptolaemus montrouzieri TaxID=559131 RepID=A0ABD2NSG7_9CUCU
MPGFAINYLSCPRSRKSFKKTSKSPFKKPTSEKLGEVLIPLKTTLVSPEFPINYLQFKSRMENWYGSPYPREVALNYVEDPVELANFMCEDLYPLWRDKAAKSRFTRITRKLKLQNNSRISPVESEVELY